MTQMQKKCTYLVSSIIIIYREEGERIKRPYKLAWTNISNSYLMFMFFSHRIFCVKIDTFQNNQGVIIHVQTSYENQFWQNKASLFSQKSFFPLNSLFFKPSLLSRQLWSSKPITWFFMNIVSLILGSYPVYNYPYENIWKLFSFYFDFLF